MFLIVLIAFLVILYLVSGNMAQLETAKRVISSWRVLAERYGKLYKVPPERVLAHIVVESSGRQYALRNDKLKTSYYASTQDDAFIKLSDWERRGASALYVSIGLMQVVPAYALVDFNRRYFSNIRADQLLDASTNVQVGTGYLALLRERFGSLDKASRAYNGSLNNPVTAVYLQKVLSYEKLIQQLLKE